jgi:hypothetical protein
MQKARDAVSTPAKPPNRSKTQQGNIMHTGFNRSADSKRCSFSRPAKPVDSSKHNRAIHGDCVLQANYVANPTPNIQRAFVTKATAHMPVHCTATHAPPHLGVHHSRKSPITADMNNGPFHSAATPWRAQPPRRAARRPGAGPRCPRTAPPPDAAPCRAPPAGTS